MRRRMLSLTLAVLILVSALPLNAIALAEEGETLDYSADVGKYVKLNQEVSAFSVYNKDTGNTFTYYQEDFQPDTILRIAEWKVDGAGLWYRLEFYKGGTQGDYVADFPAQP